MTRSFPTCITALLALCLLAGCETSTLPTAKSLSKFTLVFRERAQPEFDALERQKADGTLSEADYLTAKAELEDNVVEKARDAAWARHSLAESEREALGLPTPGRQGVITVANPLMSAGGVAGAGAGVSSGGSLYRPFTQQSQGALGNSAGMGMGILPGSGGAGVNQINNPSYTPGTNPMLNRNPNSGTGAQQPPQQY